MNTSYLLKLTYTDATRFQLKKYTTTVVEIIEIKGQISNKNNNSKQYQVLKIAPQFTTHRGQTTKTRE